MVLSDCAPSGVHPAGGCAVALVLIETKAKRVSPAWVAGGTLPTIAAAFTLDVLAESRYVTRAGATGVASRRGAEASDWPMLLTATTSTKTGVPLGKPPSRQDVDWVSQDVIAVALLALWKARATYPVIAVPPSDSGAVQLTPTEPSAAAKLTLLGAEGGVWVGSTGSLMWGLRLRMLA